MAKRKTQRKSQSKRRKKAAAAEEKSVIVPVLKPTVKYPRTIKAGNQSYRLRLMTADHRDEMVAFARSLPEDDLLFLRMDITQRSVVDQWVQSVEAGRRFTVLAFHRKKLVGYGSLNRQELSWTRHLGEIRIIVAPEHRRSGLGALLAHEIFAVARDSGLTKIVAQMPRTQKGARNVFAKLGFNLESMLADWVIDRDGRTHDLLIMSYDPTGLTD